MNIRVPDTGIHMCEGRDNVYYYLYQENKSLFVDRLFL